MEKYNKITSLLKGSDVKTKLTQALKSHHSIYKGVDLKPEGKYAESLVNSCLQDLGIKSSNEPNSHKVGSDISIEDGSCELNISMKSGDIKTANNNETLCFSSYRTSSIKEFDQKLKYSQDNLNKEDMIIFLVPKSNEETKGIEYSVYALDPKKIDLTSLAWKKSRTKKGNINFKGDGNFKASFTGAMSGQLWVTVGIEKLDLLFSLEV